jgi:23S rRNA (uracil1939-C5)-methyltransferase
MKNKNDGPKRNKAELPRKIKDPEFKPFWSADPPKKDDTIAARTTDQSRPTARKPTLKTDLPKDHEQTATIPARSARASGPGKPFRPAQDGTGAPRSAASRSDRPADGERKRTSRPDSAYQGDATNMTDGAPRAARPPRTEHTPGTGAAVVARQEPLRESPHRPASKPGHIAPAEHRAHHRSELPQGADQKPNLHSGMTLELKIAATTNEGFGVSMHEGKRVLVAGGLPGEQLVARVTYVGRREAFANTLKCIKVSPDRQPAPACSMGKCCDGCGLMQMRYPAQLVWKKSLVAREIRKYPSLAEVQIQDALGSPRELNYRNSAKLVVAGKFSEPVIGIYRRNTHEVLEIDDCPLHHPLINQVVKAAKVGIRKGKVAIYNPKSEMGLLRYLVVRVAEPSDRVMVVLVTSEQGYNEMHHLAKHIQQAVPEVAVVAQNINNSTGNVIFGHKDRFITKAQTLRAYLGEKTFSLSPHSFFQVNSGAAEIIYEKVRELAALTGVERVIDVYCGIGGISIFLADQAREVVGIEFVEAAVADATENAALNRAGNCRFVAGDAAHLIDEIGEDGGADLIVLNPPRKGCEEKVLESVAGIKPARIIYVSCSPETLSRDLDILSRLGYRTLQVHPVDMFPQTIHVEDVALLERIEA